ncbi:MAG TPA: hypothetical protein DCG32_01860 [Sphaerochaeta sp.]|nr:hypothetical protein [Sphaerochaeta sp.]
MHQASQVLLHPVRRDLQEPLSKAEKSTVHTILNQAESKGAGSMVLHPQICLKAFWIHCREVMA